MLPWYFGNIGLIKIHWTALVHTSFQRPPNEINVITKPKTSIFLESVVVKHSNYIWRRRKWVYCVLRDIRVYI